MDRGGNNCSYTDNPVNCINGRGEEGGTKKSGKEELKKEDNSERKKV